MSEKQLIEHCAPTLAGIKTGNLFSIKNDGKTEVIFEIRKLNRMLRDKGLRVVPLKKAEKYILIYVYRPSYLKRDLNNPKAINILTTKGYKADNPEYLIAQLVKRLVNDSSFPHEIGLFLGYPPSDVEGFMKNPFKGVKCCGCWKAYSEPEKAEKIFKKYDRCTQIYRALNKRGKSLEQLAVNTLTYTA